MKLKPVFFLSLAVFLFLSWRFVESDQKAHDPDATLQVRMRNIGHQLLLSAGDSSSRVLPVKKVGARNFELQFESQLALNPDTLVNIVNSSMKRLNSNSSYTVNVWSCLTSVIVYGFEINEDSKKDIVPCLGRSLPKACYKINIGFQPPSPPVSRYAYVMVSFISCLLLAFLVLIKKPKLAVSKNEAKFKFIQLGNFQFFYQQQLLKLNKEEILLTSKENQVLRIFALNPNEIITRDQLQKEVWENEGVVVGRSLDVFISKLRKKLEPDPTIRIVNIHGTGYKLEVDH